MEWHIILTVALRELRDGLRSKWVILYTIAFTVLAFALARASLASAGYSGLGGFGRTAASLVNALLLFTPLLGLSVGAGSLAGDRERGTLLYLLAQPVSRAEIFWGKALGASLAASVALLGGFGLAALAIASASSGDPLAFLWLTVFTLLLMAVSLGLGFLLSTLFRTAAAAQGAALFAWLGLVFVADLGLAGVALSLRPAPAALLGMLAANPLQIYRLGAIYGLHAALDSLGPAGQYAVYRFGDALPALLSGLLLAWALLSFGAAYLLFARRRDL